MIFNRLKTRTRIYAGFISLIVLGAIVAAVGSWGIDGLGQQNRRLSVLSSSLRYVTTALQNEQLIARILLRETIQPSDELKLRFHESLDKTRDALTQAKAESLSAERRTIDQAVLDKLDAQGLSADKSFELGRAMVAGRARLWTVGDGLTTATTRFVEAAGQSGDGEQIAEAMAVERTVLLARVVSLRFLATRDKAEPEAFRKDVAIARQALNALGKFPGLAASAAPVREALTAYAEIFDSTASSMLTLDDAYETVQRPTVNAIQQELSKAEESLARDTADAARISEDVHNTASETQIGFAGFGLVAGLALAFLIGRGIVRPLTGMTNTMATLAAGNHDVTIPGAERTDEIGDMARAVEVFKTNMIEAERLSAEQEAARAARARRQDAMDAHTQAFGTSVTAVMSALGNASRKHAQVRRRHDRSRRRGPSGGS
jgi:HAMP domain-containing protein